MVDQSNAAWKSFFLEAAKAGPQYKIHEYEYHNTDYKFTTWKW
jgi:hypothetical protein